MSIQRSLISKAQGASGPGRPPRWFPWVWLCLGLVVALCYALFSILLDFDEKTIRLIMVLEVALFGLYALIHRRSPERVLFAILMCGFILRIGYMLYTPYAVRNHDVGTFADAGHLGYIYQLFQYGSLPQSNEYEFYQPPFQHIVEALVVRVFAAFQRGTALDVFEAAKIVPCFASCAVLLVTKRLCEATRLSTGATTLALAVVAFHPTFFLLSASINNDALTLLFFLISVLYTIRWYREPTMKHILILALAIGLAAMTKLSGAQAAFFTAPVFLLMVLKQWKTKNSGRMVGQFAAFLIVCAPLALWYPIRNKLLFGQPLNYVFEISPVSPLYCGDRTIVERFLSFPTEQILKPLYCHPVKDYNIWLYTLKCSVFGEYTFQNPEILAVSLILLNGLLIVISLAAMVYVLIRAKETDRFARFGLFGLWLIQMISFVTFNLRYPFGCTMDFRYILPTAIIGALYVGIALDRLQRSDLPSVQALWRAGRWVIGLFAVASALFYTL